MKKIPYARQNIDFDDTKAVKRALLSDYLTQGPLVKKFEKHVSDYCKVKYAVAVNSGTSALHIACLALGLKKGDEGITTPLTFVASSNCMLYCRATPVFSDILEDTACIDPSGIEYKLSNKTKVIIPVHFGGHPCDMDRIYWIANKKNVPIIEDACHALGSRFKGSITGSCRHSAMTVFSFHAVKHITTGEGGMVLTNNKDLFERLKMFRSHGITRVQELIRPGRPSWYYEMQLLGFNYRLTDIQSALGISQMNKVDTFIKRRAEIVHEYDSAFSSINGLSIIHDKPYVVSSHHLYVIKLDLKMFKSTRNVIFSELYKNGILANLHYIPVYYHPFYRKLGYKKGLCPHAEDYYERAITLPLYPKMTDRDVRFVIDRTKKVLKRFTKDGHI